jgi:integrase
MPDQLGIAEPSPRLTDRARTRDGTGYNPQADLWVIRAGVQQHSFNFGLVKGAAAHMMPPLKATIQWYLENASEGHSLAMLKRFAHFFATTSAKLRTDVESITVETILNCRDALTPSTAWYLSTLAGGIKKWAALGWHGVRPEAISLLNELRLKGNLQGEAVRTMDPLAGPLTDIERQGLVDALKNAWSAGQIDRENHTLGWIAILLAARPIQIATLKVRDLIVSIRSDGTTQHILRCPRAKQRGQALRTEFKDRALIPGVGAMLSSHLDDIRNRFVGLITNVENAPIFPAGAAANYGVPGFEFHATPKEIGRRITCVLEGLGARSERTGRPLNITLTRLRRTLGTHAAIEGYGELVIAERLDHSDMQSAGVYVEATPEIVERIDRAVAMRVAPLAQAFAGVIIEGDISGAEGIPVRDRRHGDGQCAAGACGKHGFCGLAAPVACYTCRHFLAWIDGPHQEILDGLLAEREQLMAEGSARIAAANDRTILAVAQVVAMCADRRGGLPIAVNG